MQIIITEKNIHDAYGRIHKFFCHNPQMSFLSWYEFDCGKRKNKTFSSDESSDQKKKQLFILKTEKNESEIRIIFKENQFDLIRIGDTVSFLNNRIIIKSEWKMGDYHYLYQTYEKVNMDSSN